MPFLLLSSFRSLVDTVHRRLADAGYPGITSTHGFALQAIGEECTSVELGQRLGVTKQAAARTAANLEAAGLIARVPSRTDRRERLLTPTARGRRMLQLSGLYFAEAVAGWRAIAGDEAVDATLATLSRAGAGTVGVPESR